MKTSEVGSAVKAKSMILQAYKQQQLTGRKNADVAFFVMGKWPESGKKRLLGKHGGPVGRCMAEYEDSVLCLFHADEVIRHLSKFLPTITIGKILSTPAEEPKP